MNLEKKLEKLGIQTIREFTPREVRYIAEEVTEALVRTFPILEEKYNEILIKLLNCKMYFSNVKKDSNISNVNYIYENNSIYFSNSINFNKIDDIIIHECIHYLQDSRTDNGKLKKIGLCDFDEFSTYGMGINEAAVQYMASKSIGRNLEVTKKNEIILKTISPNYYPFLTNLIYQIIYLLGENVIVEGVITSKENFEDMFLNTFEEKANVIIKKFDRIIDLRNKANEELKLESKEVINKEIVDIYLELQDIIVKTYFDKICDKINTIDEVDFYAEKIINYKQYIGIVEEKRFDFNDEFEQYKQSILNKFDRKVIEISKENSKNTLSVVYNNRLFRFFKKIISYFTA